MTQATIGRPPARYEIFGRNLSVTEIAKCCSITKHTVYNYLRRESLAALEAKYLHRAKEYFGEED